jgi:hypothetical protein
MCFCKTCDEQRPGCDCIRKGLCSDCQLPKANPNKEPLIEAFIPIETSKGKIRYKKVTGFTLDEIYESDWEFLSEDE